MLKTASSTLFEKGVPPSKKKKSKSNLTLLHPVSCLAKATLPLSLSLFDHQIRDIYSYG